MTTTTAVFFRHDELIRPVLKVVARVGKNGRHDVQIVLRSERDEHLSLHQEESGLILLTHRSPDKPASVWDQKRIELARRAGLLHPERHGSYYQHYPLAVFEGVEGHYLLGKLVDLASVPAGRYAKGPHIVVSALTVRFTLHIHLTTPGQRLAPDTPHVSTVFGALYFRTTEPLRFGASRRLGS